MNHENLNIIPVVDVEPDYIDYIPQDFRQNPLAYFEENGVNIKSGNVSFDENGEIDEDPTAVKDFPIWTNSAGQMLSVVAKRVNVKKAQVRKTSDPFYEYKVMETVRKLGLPVSRPIAKTEQAGVHIIIMERVPGFRWVNNDIKTLKEKGYSADDLARIESEANNMMVALSKRYEDAGVIRKWKLRDMVFDLDVPNKKLVSLIPVDWERTTFNL